MFQLDEEQRLIMQSVREIVQKEIRPRETDLDETGQFPWETVRILAENDILNALLPRRYGGPEVSFFTFSMIIEEISRASASSALLLITQAEGILPIALGANESLKEKYLSRLAGASRVLTGMGGINPSLHLSPVSSGIRADLLGEKYLLNGKRCFIRNGSIADFLVLYACTAPSEEGKGVTPVRNSSGALNPAAEQRGIISNGVNAFVVEKGNPGLVLRRDENRMGMRGSIYSEMDLENLEVPGENRIDSEGEGFLNMMKTLSLGRLFTAAQAVGLAKGAMDEAISYARRRIQFGKPISHHGQIQLMIADMATGIESARLLTYQTAMLFDQGEWKKAETVSAMAKLMASDTAMKVATDAVQIMGGYGYIKDYPVERMMRDAKLIQIDSGTNQMMKLIIGRELTGVS
ncbi:MAG: acyl-CoA dehydrogenase family protein [Deltaproteobacteria bacterium]|nr:acyl-CoA dehydrogenase family protein [Deltaproteobacteria bacterium]